jgi:hypothetical protein
MTKNSQKPTGTRRKRKTLTPTVRLDYTAAAHAASQGKTLANVARAAGSRAKVRNLRRVGKHILETLAAHGQVFGTFNRLGYAVETFARDVIEQTTKAHKVIRAFCKGECTFEARDVDWQARTAAREQYMRAVGMVGLPQESGAAPTPLEELSDDELVWLDQFDLAEAAREAAGAAQSAGQAPPAGNQPAPVDRTSVQRGNHPAGLAAQAARSVRAKPRKKVVRPDRGQPAG